MSKLNMIQTTIQLPPEMHEWLAKTASEQFDSMAGLVRRGVLLLKVQFEYDEQVRVNSLVETGGFRYPTTEEKLVVGGK